jgi:8-oxo-dGTP pyrophosphatase MutT (NUDIX family)
MEKILVLDAKNYDPSLPELLRTAVRGIIFRDGKLLLINSNFGELKFPGGGQEKGENDLDTLIRETLEETGFHVIPESVREFGEVEEIRLSTHEPMIWHMISRYYFCEVTDEQEACRYTDSEKKHGFYPVWHTLDEAIEINHTTLLKEGVLPWNKREYSVLKLIKEHLNT